MPISGFNIDQCVTASALPGVGVLEYVPLDEVDTDTFEESIQASNYNFQSEITTEWYKMPYVRGSGSWSEDQQRNDQGEYFRLNISALLPADTAVVRGELNTMRNRRYLIRLNRNGIILLLGTPEQPLRFESRFDSGSDSGDTRGHRITFTGNSLRKSPAYVPVF
jgi:hypothetical protein